MIIFGDIHAYWPVLNSYLRHLPENKISNVIVCGDFGYWPKFKEFDLKHINTERCKIYFCPGNHEDWWALPKTYEITELYKNIFYCPFGTTLNIENKNLLFCGGAESIDKQHRRIGYDWFPDEIISYQDMEHLPPKSANIDIVISHTCPSFVFNKLPVAFNNKALDPSCKMLDFVHSIFRPKLWYFGHFHMYKKMNLDNTTFTCLNEIGEQGAFAEYVNG